MFCHPSRVDRRADSLLGTFFGDSFDGGAFVRSLLRTDGGASAPASASLDESPVERTLHDVRGRSSQLDAAIRDLVARHQDALVLQAGASATLKRHLVNTREHVERAEDGLRRLRADVLDPYHQIRADADVLARATTALDLLRRLQRAHQSIRRLRALAGTVGTTAGSAGDPAPAPLLDVRTMARLAPLLREASQVRAPLALRYTPEPSLLLTHGPQIFADDSVSGFSLIAQDRGHVAAISDAVLVGSRVVAQGRGSQCSGAATPAPARCRLLRGLSWSGLSKPSTPQTLPAQCLSFMTCRWAGREEGEGCCRLPQHRPQCDHGLLPVAVPSRGVRSSRGVVCLPRHSSDRRRT